MANGLLTLSRGTKVIDLYTWATLGQGAGWQALSGIEGFGMPGQTNNWFEGAGEGASYRGSRVQARLITIPLVAESNNRAGLDNLLSSIAVTLRPQLTEQARLKYKAADGDIWYLDVVRESGGDYVRNKESNQRNYLKSSITLKAGKPFWVRENPESFVLGQDSSGDGLLPAMAELRLSAGQVFGTLSPQNVGDVAAWPIWTLRGPLTGVTLTGPFGEGLVWSGTMTAGQTRVINTSLGTIVDQAGVNRFNELGTAPLFWAIPPDELPISIATVGADAGTTITASWQPRKWSMV